MIDQSIQYLKGVGPKRAGKLSRMGIVTVRDLLGYFPREYEDRRHTSKIAALANEQKTVIAGKIETSDVVKLNASLTIFKAAISDGSGTCFAVFYRKVNPYHRHDVFTALKRDFANGNCVFVYGQAENNFGEKQIKVEEYEQFFPGTPESKVTHFNRIVPVYPLTEGINQKWFREFMQENINKYSSLWPEILSDETRAKENLIGGPMAIKQIHFPDSLASAQSARQRLAFDEFLLLQTALEIVRAKNKSLSKPYTYIIKRNLLTPFKNNLKFEFTTAQKKVINEIFHSLSNPAPMNRLLMGDVGSGKTVVALSAILLAVENGYQAALVAPTEILAEQHYLTITNVLSGLPVHTSLLTGRLSLKKKEKQELYDCIASGKTDIVIGTHALLEEQVKFKNLSLIVIDEQHRFGVIQRAQIQQKTTTPDVLVMTATPIPRTLSLTLYGDLDVSVIDQLPKGRIPIETRHTTLEHGYKIVKDEISCGRQAYIVYPLIEESDKLELKAAVKEAKELSESIFKDFRVGLLHGQMPKDEKEKIMLDFREGKYDILIATTVIEVGIDVPNATVMVIEHADRFGLATLHQLRGRVGRGTHPSFCVLLGNPKTEDAKRRFDILTSTRDGFLIAEEDLALRGPGEFFGTAQHGMPPLRAGNLITDASLIAKTKKHAAEIIAKDPQLSDPTRSTLRHELIRTYHGKFGLSKIG